jgi:hypothetical protein
VVPPFEEVKRGWTRCTGRVLLLAH